MMIAPQLLILDEPFANLDPGSQIRLKNILRHLRETHGTTMLISSHDLGHVTDICERIALLNQGIIVRDLTTSDATLHELEVFFTVAD
jgi:ABC-2 type transport system ATP-binding protein